ncbi:MAG: chemotaxis protein CheA [Bacteroidia bacterium]|jgi:two-component system chemotaxis sensor kinase CheA|nr:chemotaxis protein CheA [Bacteroidia bacterium]
MGKEEEYKELFLAEAQENYEELNQLFTRLEKDPAARQVIEAIFRIIHTLKGNAMGMGFQDIASLSHVIEDIFNEVKLGRLVLDTAFFSHLFKAIDVLGRLIMAQKTGETVAYKGIRTKLEVALRNARQQNPETPAQDNTPLHTPETPTAQTVETPLAEAADITENDTPEDDLLTGHQLTLSDTVQVPVRKLDHLLNIIGELIIERDTLLTQNIRRGFPASDINRLNRITSDLQFGVMDIRMVQVGFLFSKFHRIMRDVAALEEKKTELILEGTEIEIDRNILRIMSDSLVHLIRNAVSHGIEKPEERLRKGKAAAGTVRLSARSEKDTVFIDVTDDGNGIDAHAIKRKALEKGLISAEYAKIMTEDEALSCIFLSGFSNAEKVTSVSGRGIGMDVVKRSVESIGGTVTLTTEPGKGSRFTLSLPSSMAVKGALLFEIQEQAYAIALSHTEAVVAVDPASFHKVGAGLVTTYLDKTIGVFHLGDIFDGHSQIARKYEPGKKVEMIVVSYHNRYAGFVVDKLMQQKEIVEKTLSKPVDHVTLFSGATILGSGDVCLVLNIAGILSGIFKEMNYQRALHV